MSDKAFVFITGMAGPDPLPLCNGRYDRTSETFGGYPVFVSRGVSGLCIVHRNGDWEIKSAAGKDSDCLAAYVKGGCPLEACVSRVWKVNGPGGSIDQPSVKIVLGEEGERQVRCCCELARTGTPSCISYTRAQAAELEAVRSAAVAKFAADHAAASNFHRSAGSVVLNRHRGGGYVSHDYMMHFEQYNTFVADVRLCGSCFYFEITVYESDLVVLSDVFVQFGFCTQGFEAARSYASNGTGDDAFSWAVDGCRQLKWHQGETNGGAFGSKWSAGDVIGFAVDMRNSGAAIFSASVNGSFVAPNGVAFKRITAPYLSPAFSGVGLFRVNFGDRPFAHSPPTVGFVSVHDASKVAPRVACERYDAKAFLKKWDSGFITMSSSLLAFGSTEDKAISGAVGRGSAADANAVMHIAGCVCNSLARDGKRHVMSVSFPTGGTVQYFAFSNTVALDSFMLALQTRSAALAALPVSTTAAVLHHDTTALSTLNSLPPPAFSATASPAQPSHSAASDMPDEDARFSAAYEQALKSSGRPFFFTQLCLVGEGRSGKTALANSLCGRAFQQTDSTIGVGLEQMEVSQTGLEVAAAGSWSVLQHATGRTDMFAENQLAWAIAQELDGKQRSSGGGSGSIADIIRVPELQTSFDFADDPLAMFSLSGYSMPASTTSVSASLPSLSPAASAPTQSQSRPQSSVDQGDSDPSCPAVTVQQMPSTEALSSVRPTDVSSPITRMNKQLVLQRSREEEPLRINLLDFGGQKAFYSLHSLYLTRNSVYLVVFNMQWLVGPTANEAAGLDGITKRVSCLNYLTFWLNSIYLHTKPEDQSAAPILLVGTHRDCVDSPSEHEVISSMIHQKFNASPAFDSVIPFKQGTASAGRGLLWFYPVDNTKSSTDQCVESIKGAVQDCLKKEEYLKRKVPLPWLQTLDAIQATKQLHITLTQVKSIAQQNGLPVTQLPLEDEVMRMLKYFSDLGLLMHHNCPTLRHLVVLDTLRCLVNPASIVMCQHDIHMLEVHELARRTKSEAYRRLTTQGILDKSLLCTLWTDCDDIIDEVAQLMVMYGLMLPLLEKARGAFSQYLVPSLLPDHAGASAQDGVISHCYFLFGTKDQTASWEKIGNVASSVVSSHGFCPAGLFSRLTGKIVSECQSTYNYFGSCYGVSQTMACFGQHVFVVKELLGMNMIQLLVMVENPRKLVSEISRLVQLVINEMIPSLGFISAVFEDGGSGQNFQRETVETAHFVSLNHAIKCIASGSIVHLNSITNSSMSAANSRTLFQRWVPPSGLRDFYDVFLSYRWTGSFDEDLTLGLFNNLSEEVCGSSGREINVFLDKRRLQDGRNFQDDFAAALLNTSVPVVILSVAALQRMVKLNADSPIDNLLLEWTLIVELLHSKTITHCLPIIIGTYNPSAPSCAAVISDFFRDVVKAADGSVIYSGIDSLPDVSVTSIILKVRLLLQQHNLTESPALCSHTVRSVVKHVSLHQAVFASNLFQDPRFQDVPASHAKEEVTRTVVEHCGGKIRSMLDSIEAQQALAASAAAQHSTGVDGNSLDDLAQRLRIIGLSNDAAVLSDLSTKLQRDGVTALEDLRGLSEEEMKLEVASLNLKRVQFNKLFKAVSEL